MRKTRKRMLGALLAMSMLTMLLPGTAFAAAAAPTGSGNGFFANGTPITITKEAPAEAQAATLDGFTATGTDAYISWTQDGAVKYVGVSKNILVFGGGDGRTAPVTVPSTSITMTGGTIANLFGGNLGAQNKDASKTSVVTGDVSISISGADALVGNLLHGGGQYNNAVNGTVTIRLDGVDLSTSDWGGAYVNGGVHGNGTEGTRDIAGGTMDTPAVVNKVVIEVKNSKLLLLGGGGSGSTKVGSADVTITDSQVGNVFLGGINGVTEQSKLTVNGTSKIDELAATNRGFVGSATANIDGDVTIGTWATGAAEGCFSSDSGAVDGSGVTGSVAWNLGSDVTVAEAKLTPYVTSGNGAYTAEFGGVTINKQGKPVQLEAAGFVPNAKKPETVVTDFAVSQGKTLAVSGAAVEVPADVTVANEGVIAIGDNASLKAAEGSTLVNDGSITVAATGALESVGGAVQNDGVIDVYPGGKTEGDIEGQKPVSPYHTVTVTANEGGSVTPSGNVVVREGENVTFAITANEGYSIADVKVDGVSIGAKDSVTLEAVEKAHTIEVTFAQQTVNPTPTPSPDIPKTGESSAAPWMALLMLGMAGVAAGVVLQRKKHNA